LLYYYEDFEIGQTFSTGKRVLTENDIASFANLTGDFNKLHFDQDFATSVGFDGTVSHGLLTLSIAVGLWHSLGITNGSVSAFAGLDRVSFKAPVYPGDEVKAICMVLGKRELSSKKNAGLLRIRLDVSSQKNIVVMEAELALIILKRSGSDSQNQ
jgi:acyl dehydratase